MCATRTLGSMSLQKRILKVRIEGKSVYCRRVTGELEGNGRIGLWNDKNLCLLLTIKGTDKIVGFGISSTIAISSKTKYCDIPPPRRVVLHRFFSSYTREPRYSNNPCSITEGLLVFEIFSLPAAQHYLMRRQDSFLKNYSAGDYNDENIKI